MKRKRKKAAKRLRRATKTAAQPAVPPIATTVAKLDATTLATTVRKHRARRKRVSIVEALRRRGLDEYRFAERFEKVGEEEGGVKKTDFDYLKEWSRYLAPLQLGERESNEEPVPLI